MIQIFLSYARADGLEAATRLHSELNAMGFQVWRDIEEMEGGNSWKEQLRIALRTVDAVLVLLTPGAVASATVNWEWETALTLGKRLIPLLILPCMVPTELKPLHYHTFSQAEEYTLSLAHLVRDLVKLAVNDRQRMDPSTQQDTSSKYSVGVAIHSAVGEQPVVINQGGRGKIDAASVTQIIAALRDQAKTQAAVVGGGVPSEIQTILDEIQTQVAGVGSVLAQVAKSQESLLAHFDQHEQRLLQVISTRLDAQTLAVTAALLDLVDGGALAATELDRHFAVIRSALFEVVHQQAQITDRQLVEESRSLLDVADDPRSDARHRLKVTLPIVPLLLSYEGEIELSSSLNLRRTWEALKRLVKST